MTKELWLRQGWGEVPLAYEGLFDLHNDPEEHHDLVGNAVYEGVLNELRGLMVARMERFENPLLRRYRVASPPR